MNVPFVIENKQQKILIVDDMSLSRLTATNLLKELGFHNITIAENGQQAFDILSLAIKNQDPFALVLSDWMMPELDGIGLMKRINQSEWAQSPHFILMTAESDMANIAHAIKSGISGYIKKPVLIESLKEALENIANI